MMRYLSLCLVLFTVACGPSNDNDTNSEVESYRPKAGANSESVRATSIDLSQPVLPSKDYPIAPDATLTPGVRCAHPDEMRYPEKIAYCERNVTSGTKRSVISKYDDTLGYNMENMDRSLFKIDHYIPLCMGGDNAKTNLWPQHEQVYSRTDKIEESLCLLLARGKITQDESIEQMLYAKAHLDETSDLLAKIKELL